MSTTTILSNPTRTGTPLYPFSDSATMTSQGGTLVLAPGFFADAILYPPGGGVGQYLSQVVVDRGRVTLSFSDTTGVLCTTSYNPSNAPNPVVLTDTYGRVCGALVASNQPSSMGADLNDGTYNFGPNDTPLVACCVVPQPVTGVQGFLLDDGTFLSGDVWLAGGPGVVLRYDDSDNTIRVHVVGDPLFVDKACQTGPQSSSSSSESGALGPVLRSLKLVLVDQGGASITLHPDEFGNIHLTPGSNQNPQNVIRIVPIQNGLEVEVLGSTDLTTAVPRVAG